MHYQFHKDLAEAEKTEGIVASAMSRYYKAKIVGMSDGSNWDFVLQSKKDSRKIPIEVKEDYIAERTGNIAIEYHSRNKESGIKVTKARYYVYRIRRTDEEDDFLLLSVTKLKSWIKREKYWKSVSGGDSGSDTRMYLFKLKDILDDKGFFVLPKEIFKGLLDTDNIKEKDENHL